MKNSADNKIWEDFKAGKDETTSIIYDRNVDFLFYYGKKFTQDEGLILDTIHDLFIYLIQKRESLGSTNNIKLYLLKSFRRRLFDELKKQNMTNSLEESDKEPTFVISVEDRLIQEEEELSRQEIELALKQLNTQQREILYYKFNCNLSYDEICEIMSISYDAARQKVSRALQTLKKYLGNKPLILLLLLKLNLNFAAIFTFL